MRRTLGLLGVLALLVWFTTDVPPPRPAHAAGGVIVVTNNCGTPAQAPSTGQQLTFVDQNGNLCTNGAGGGGGSVTQGTTPWLVAPVPTAVAGNAIAYQATILAASNLVLKASAGNLYDAYVTTGATAGYLMIFDAVSAPADGTVRPVECVVVPANSTTSIWVAGSPPEAYTTGITMVFSSTGCFTKTASATAFLHGRAQ